MRPSPQYNVCRSHGTVRSTVLLIVTYILVTVALLKPESSSSGNRMQNLGKLVLTVDDEIGSPLFADNCTSTPLASCPLSGSHGRCGGQSKVGGYTTDADKSSLQQNPPQRHIPKTVWQTWKSKQLPSCNFEKHRRLLQAQNPTWEFRLVDDDEANMFIDKYFQGKVARAFHSINPKFGAARADLLRYCLLYIFGGVYLDLDSSLNCPLDDWICEDDVAILSYENNIFPRPEHTPELQAMYQLLASSNNGSTPESSRIPATPPAGLRENTMVQWLLVFAPKQELLRNVIDLVTDQVIQWQDSSTPGTLQAGISPHTKIVHLTGPPAFTMGIWNALLPLPSQAEAEGQHASGKATIPQTEKKLSYKVLGVDYENYATYKYKDSHRKDPEGSHYDNLPYTEPFKVAGARSLSS